MTVIKALEMPFGGAVALSLDWATFTCLSTYFRIGFPAIRDFSYREVAFGGSTALCRSVAVFATGMAAGFAFAFKHPAVWLIALALLVFAHSLLYVLLYKHQARP